MCEMNNYQNFSANIACTLLSAILCRSHLPSVFHHSDTWKIETIERSGTGFVWRNFPSLHKLFRSSLPHIYCPYFLENNKVISHFEYVEYAFLSICNIFAWLIHSHIYRTRLCKKRKPLVQEMHNSTDFLFIAPPCICADINQSDMHKIMSTSNFPRAKFWNSN